jgi:hypothetical protein
MGTDVADNLGQCKGLRLQLVKVFRLGWLRQLLLSNRRVHGDSNGLSKEKEKEKEKVGGGQGGEERSEKSRKAMRGTLKRERGDASCNVA